MLVNEVVLELNGGNFLALQGNLPQNFEQFKIEILKHFEPINRELNARRNLNSIK